MRNRFSCLAVVEHTSNPSAREAEADHLQDSQGYTKNRVVSKRKFPYLWVERLDIPPVESVLCVKECAKNNFKMLSLLYHSLCLVVRYWELIPEPSNVPARALPLSCTPGLLPI